MFLKFRDQIEDNPQSGKLQQALAAPDTHHSHPIGIPGVDDAKRGLNQLAKMGEAELGGKRGTLPVF
jgi:hypothetical protein